jgi:hypothetical protein
MKNNTIIAALTPITIEEMIAIQVMSTFAPICYSPRPKTRAGDPI